MSILETIERARAFLERNGRVSLRVLKHEFELDEEALDELVEELVDVQRVATRDGMTLAWAEPTPAAGAVPRTRESEPVRDPRDYTPKHLAEKILRSRSALEGERKQVTVLFADVKGSTELAEQVGAEEWHGILDRFFSILTEGVHRFEGTVNQYTGDGIMALFGAPIAHEDHAQRACHSALHLRDELRVYADQVRRAHELDFSTRMGLHSGEVVVGKIGDDLRMDYTAQGRVVHLAQRMEQLAAPGRVYVTAQTAARVAGFFRLRDLGPMQLKGWREPVHVHELEDAGEFQTRFAAAQARGLSRFVGRQRELAVLEAALQRATGGVGQVVGIVAEAGTGKSRLTYEFAEACRARGFDVFVGSCPPHGRSVPLGLILSEQRDDFRITERDSDAQAREKIAASLSRLGPATARFIPFMTEFLGVAEATATTGFMDPALRHRELLRYFEARARVQRDRGVVVVVLDDMQWADDASVGVSFELNRIYQRVPSLVVMNFRPEYRPPEAAWPTYEEVRLEPLTAESTDELLGHLLGPEATGRGLESHIQERAAGNPFFAEEIVLSLAESGALAGTRGAYRIAQPVGAIHVPDSVLTVLAARIDRLGEQAKGVLQVASVIGKEFPVPLLEGVARLSSRDLTARLHELAQSEFVYQEATHPEVEYAFKHPLTHQVAYESQLREPRRHVHRTVAGLLEDRYPDRLGEKAALIAHHWSEGGKGFEAARWHRRAAEWMSARDVGEAFGQWRRVCSRLETVPESRERSELRLAGLLQILNLALRTGLSLDEAAFTFAEARKLAVELDDPRSLALAFNTYSVVLAFEGRLTESLEHCEDAWQAADRTDDLGLRLLARMDKAHTLYQLGQPERALEVCERALEETPEDLSVGRAIRGFSPSIQLAWFRGWFSTCLGRLPQAKRYLTRGLELAQEHGEVELCGWIRFYLADWCCYAGDGEAGLRYARSVLENAEQTGSRIAAAHGQRCLGNAQITRRAWGDAVDALEESLRITREERVTRVYQPLILAWLADACLGTGQVERALATASEAIETSRRMGTRWKEIAAQLARARAVRARGAGDAPDEVATALGAADDLVRDTGARVYLPFIREERAALAARLGDEAGRTRELREAQRLYRQMGATGHAERLARELGP